MLVIGVDIGSAASKAVILDHARRIVGTAVVQGGAGTSGPERVMQTIFQRTGLHWPDMTAIVATGYGRITFSQAHRHISEISAHARGVYHLLPATRTIIDVGGQDVKVMALLPNGGVGSFFMNDKCAAGTGRFLEVMARVLEVEVGQLGALATQGRADFVISNTCAVFAESEVISHLAAGATTADVAAGIVRAVASRVAGLVERVGINPELVFTGGVARNAALVAALSQTLRQPIAVAPDCELTGALGAALAALDQ